MTSATPAVPATATHLSPVVVLYFLGVIFPLLFRLGPLSMTSLRLLLLGLTVPLMINLFRGRYGRIIWTDTLFVLFVVWSFISLLVNNPNQAIENAGSTGVEFLGGYVFGRAYVRNAEQFLRLCRFLATCVLLMFPFALYETMTGQSLFITLLNAVPGVKTVAIVYMDKRMGLDRVQLAFAHPIHFGLFCSFVVPLVFVAMRDRISNVKRIFLAGTALITGSLALSSGALLAMALQCALVIWSTVFARIKWRWWLLLGLFVLAYVVIDLLSNRSPIRVFLSYATFSAHTAYWRSIIFEWGMINVWANPIFGLGLRDWVRPSYMYSGSMDNFWLVNAVRFGIPGFLLLTVGMILVLYGVMRRNFDEDHTLLMIRRAWVFMMMGLIFTLCTVHVWGNVYSCVMFIFGAGVWIMDAQSNAEARSTEAPSPRAEQRYSRDFSEEVATAQQTNPTPEAAAKQSLPYSRFPPRHQRKPS